MGGISMKKNPGNKMPTTKILLLYSWLIAIVALIASGYLIFQFRGVNSLLLGLSILMGAFLFSTIIRTLGNIAQMFFDMNNRVQELITQNSTVIQTLKDIANNAQESVTESKEINQYVRKLEAFFEEVAKEE
jgi:hypothetical protein